MGIKLEEIYILCAPSGHFDEKGVDASFLSTGLQGLNNHVNSLVEGGVSSVLFIL